MFYFSIKNKNIKEGEKEKRSGRRKEEKDRKEGRRRREGWEEGKKALQVGLQLAIFNGRLEMSFTQALAQMKHTS